MALKGVNPPWSVKERRRPAAEPNRPEKGHPLSDDLNAFTNAITPDTTPTLKCKIDRWLDACTDPDLRSAVWSALNDRTVPTEQVEAGFWAIGFPCSDTTVHRWRRRNNV